MAAKLVPDFNSVVLHYLKSVGDGSLPIDNAQLAELPPQLGKSIANRIEDVADAGTMTRLSGKIVKAAQSKVDMNELLQYFSTGALDAESPLANNNLDRPISNYFINSSHNTYLTGNQLYGNASTEAYRDVLRKGCRSIEIDVWDSKSNSSGSSDKAIGDRSAKSQAASVEPRVLHGHTLTKEVSFRDVCQAIGETAFQTSNMPVIVSLEVHAHSEQQEKMVQIMKETWQGRLVSVPEKENTKLPSPQELSGKILVKVKGAAIIKPEDAKGKEDSSQSGSEDESAPGGPSQGQKPSKIIPGLSALGVYTRAYHFKNFQVPEASLPTHVFSLSENKVIAVHQSDGPSLFRHNRSFLMRAFPSGSRVTSSNLDPPAYWRKGIQMVALNWQRTDASIMLNHAMFSGSTGWVLKPVDYQSPLTLASGHPGPPPADRLEDVKRCNLDLSVHVLAAQSLPPAKHPYVKCELHVETPQERKGEKVEGDGGSKDGEHKRRTKVSRNLDFKGEKLEFTNIREVVPALSFVRFKVMDDVLGPDELVAWGCVRLDRLKSGLRFLHLLDPKGHDIDAVLLVNTHKKVS